MRAFNRVVYKGPVMGLAATGPLTPIDTWELLGSARSLVLQLRLLRTAAPASGSLTITLETSNDGDLWFQSALTPFAVLTGLLSTDFRTVTQVNGCFVRFRFGWLVAGDAGQLWVGASGRISREAQERKTDCGCGNKTDQTSAPALQDPSDVVGRQWLPPGALRKALGAAHPRSLAGALPVGRGGSGEPGPRDEPRGIVPRGQVPPPIVVVRRPRDSSEVPTLPVPCLGLTTLPQDRLLGRFEAADRAGSRLPDGVRVQGAWIAPLNRVVVAYPGYRRGVSRLWVASVGTAPCGRDFGRPAGPPALALTGTEAMQGVSSTSVRNPDGSVDAVFAVWDSLAGGSIRVFSVSGRDGAPGATTTVVQSPADGVGDVGLAAAVGPDDRGHARFEAEGGRVGE